MSAIGFADSAFADISISAGQTQNMTCNTGVCVPTAADAVLGVGDLEEMLKTGNVSVSTAGSGVQANNIVVAAKLAWKNGGALDLDSYQSITINAPVRAKGKSSIVLTSNDGGAGGTFSLGSRGKIEFGNRMSNLTINGARFTLVNTIPSLGRAIAANPSGSYALAKDYDSSIDRPYNTAPIKTPVTGTVQGLGNAVLNVVVNFSKTKLFVSGLFQQVQSSGSIQNLRVLNERVVEKKGAEWGGLVGRNYGLLFNDAVSGVFKARHCTCNFPVWWT